MDKKDKDKALFVAFCIEEYGAAKAMTGEQVFDLFSRYGVVDYLSKCFGPLHTQSRQYSAPLPPLPLCNPLPT